MFLDKLIYRLTKKDYYRLVLVAEFDISSESDCLIANLTGHIKKITSKKDIVYTELQKFPKGYRVSYSITYYNTIFRKKNYTRELTNFFDWFIDDKSYVGHILKYSYNCSNL